MAEAIPLEDEVKVDLKVDNRMRNRILKDNADVVDLWVTRVIGYSSQYNSTT